MMLASFSSIEYKRIDGKAGRKKKAKIVEKSEKEKRNRVKERQRQRERKEEILHIKNTHKSL